MKELKKIISGILILILIFNGLPIQYSKNMEGIQVYAEGIVLSEMDITVMDRAWLTLDRIFGGSNYSYDPNDQYSSGDPFGYYDYSVSSVTNAVYMPVAAPNGSTICWTSSNEEVIDLNGKVTRPDYLQGANEVKLVATFSKGEVQLDAIYKVRVSPSDPTSDEQSVLDDRALLEELSDTEGWLDLAGVTGSHITLPSKGGNGSIISWASSNETMITPDGTITRPSYSSFIYYYNSSVPVTLTASISKGEVEVVSTFNMWITSPSGITTEDELAIEDFYWLYNLVGTEGWGDMSGFEGEYVAFPVIGLNGSTISWSSDHPEMIESDGIINRPTSAEGDIYLYMSFVISRGPSVMLKSGFYIKILADRDAEELALDKDWLTEELVLDGNSADAVRARLNLPKSGPNRSTINWSFSKEGIITSAGAVMRPSEAQGDQAVTLTATISRRGLMDVKTFTLTVSASTPEEEKALLEADTDWLYPYIFYGIFPDDIRESWLDLPVVGPNGSAISWVSSESGIVAISGNVTRPAFSYAMGRAPVTLTATITRREAAVQQAYDLKIFPQPPTAEDRVAYYKPSLTDEVILNGNIANNVKTRLYLPTTSGSNYYGDMAIGDCTITWQSTHPEVIAPGGTVTRPPKGQMSMPVTLKATISYGEASDESTFNFIVTPMEEFPLAINYDDFSNTDRLQFNGISGMVDTSDRDGNPTRALLFESGDGAAGGSVFTKNKVRLGDDLSFSTAFSFRNLNLGQYYDLNGNGGFTFTLQAVSSTVYGQSLYDESIKPGLSIAFVTSRSEHGSGQAVYPYFDVSTKAFYNGDFDNGTDGWFIGGTRSDLPPDYYNAWIEYNGTAKVLEVWCVTSAERPGYTYTHLRAENVDLGEILTGAGSELTVEDVRDVYAGFMGSMGDARDNSEIYNWYLKNDYAPIDRNIYDFYDVSKVTLSATPLGEVLNSTVTAFVSRADGPAGGIPVEFSTDFGSLDQSTVVTDDSGNATVTLSADHTGVAHVKAAARGGAMDETEAQLAATDEDCIAFDVDWLKNGAGRTLLLNGNSALDNVATALNLSAAGLNGSTISWTSDNVHINAADGTVILPSPAEGNQQVTISATLTKGAATWMETFSLTIRVPDTSTVSADGVWLTDDRVLNGNSAFDNVTGNLSMPVTGQYGSDIIWTSTKEDIIALNGTVVRPTYTQGDQTVALTAAISKGSVEITKTYTVTVKALKHTDLEAVTFDYVWLTGDSILNGNAGPDTITGNLNLPLLGPRDTIISWTSSNISYITDNGTVTQPAFSMGKKKVILTATVSSGSQAAQKIFEVTVMTLSQTDDEAVASDMKWLDISRTLGHNMSEFSMKESLSLPSSAPNGSLITWVSDKPGVISDSGTVARPEYTEGHKAVTLIAVFRKGSVEESKVFTYTVLALPDITPPTIKGMQITGNNTILGNYKVPFGTLVLPWYTDGINITFDEELNYQVSNGQTFSINGPNAPTFWATGWKNMIIFNLKDYLKPGANYELVIPSNYIGDKYGNQPGAEMKLQITVEEKPIRTIEVVSSTPMDKEKDIPLDISRISFKYNYIDIVKGGAFNSIILRTKAGKTVPLLSRTLNSDTVTLDLNAPLEAGVVYELIIPASAVQDRFTNESSSKTIQFRAWTNVDLPSIINVYPSDSQTDVDIHHSVEVIFSDAIKPGNVRLQLRDNQGNPVVAFINRLNDLQNGVVMTPYQPLKPNTSYTLSGPYESETNPSELDFSQSFATGTNKLGINKSSPAYRAKDVPINGSVEIEFAAPIARGPAFADIELLDSKGYAVVFHGEERGNKAILTPASDLNAAETYTVHTPKGAYIGVGDVTNDDYKFCFTTAKRLEPAPDLLDSLSTWVIGKPVQFNTDRLESTFKSAKYEITAYEWDFGDGSSGGGKNATHIFNQTGKYIVKLKVSDNKGFFYEFDRVVTIVPLQDITMSVKRTGSNNLYLASGWPMPFISYKLRLECEGVFVPGETIGVQLYKNGALQKTYGNITSGNGDSSYDFTSIPESSFIGNYELVFTYTYPTGSMTVREPVIIRPGGATSFLRVQLYDRRKGEIYHDADYLNVIVDGKKKVAVREWIESLNEYVYTVPEEFPILRYYKFTLEGFYEYDSDYGSIYNVGNLGDFYTRPPLKLGFSTGFGIAKLLNTDIFKRYYIEGVDVGNVTFAVEGDWRGLDPGYYELQTNSGGLHLTSSTGEFILRPGRDFRVGDSLMIRMLSKNGVKTDWLNYPVEVLPKPSIMGQNLDVRLVDGIYELSWPTPFDGLMGGSIDCLDGIPFLNGGNFGIGSDMPTFIGVIYKEAGIPKVIMDFSGEAGYGQAKKTTTSVKRKNNSSLKKVKSVGYEVDVAVAGELSLIYDKESRGWKTKYVVIDMDGYGSKYWSSGYKIAGIVGVEGKLELGVGVGGTLMIDKRDGSAREYSGIIRIRPQVTASVSGSYGVGDVTGYVTGYIPAEIHIPTGYMEAEVGVKAKVTASFLTYSKTLYSKELYSTHWDNGKEKVVIGLWRLMATLSAENFETEDSGLEPMDRNYLNREAVWLAGNGSAQPMQKAGTEAFSRGFALMSFEAAAAVEPNPQTDVLMENIYPNAEVQLVQSGDEQWLVWSDDNPVRDAVNRTQLRYSVLKDGTWSKPLWIDGDGTADFSPAVVSTTNGTLIAWQNISRVVSEEEGLSAMIENSEISVTGSVYSSDDSGPQIITLTHDDKLDHSPRLAADGSNALLVWTKSKGLGFTMGGETEALKAPENSDSLFFSAWDGINWSEPLEIEGSLPSVLDSNLAVHGDEGLLLYTLDMDNDLSTSEDREVFARLYNGNEWGVAIRISDNQVSDINPKAAYLGGKWLITWVRDGNILYKEGLNGKIKTEEFLQDVQNNYHIAVNEGANPQVALVYKKSGENNAQGLSASFYDMNKGVWSDEIPLAEAEGYAGSFSSVFTEDGKLKVAYSQADIINEVVPEDINGVEQLVEVSNVSDKVDLKMLTYVPAHDLTFDEEDGLQLSVEIPLPGTVTTVYATVLNEGDFAENASIDLYDGHPAEGGEIIASTVVEQPIAARSSAEVEMEWLVPLEEKDEYDLYAVVRSQEGVSERNEGNNTINLNIITADIAVNGLEYENLAKDDYLVKAVIINEGSRNLKDIEVKLEHILSCEELKIVSIERLEPGQEYPLSLLISAQGLEKDENGKIKLTLRAMLPDDVSENSIDNNVVEFALKPASIVVDRAAPGQNDTQVAVDAAVTLSFNMDVEQGAGFDQITLEDEDLNVIGFTKTLEGDTLTVTPLSLLANNTQYTLTIPVDALADVCGHIMEEPYSMSFTTMLTSPEVIFAYPGDGMGYTALDTDIRLQFSQNVAKGPAFEDITMYGPDAAKIPISVFVEGEWLDIRPVGDLNVYTTYSLAVPRGTVVNDKGEAIQEDYKLEFTTAGADEASNGEDDSQDAYGRDLDKTEPYNAGIAIGGSSWIINLPVNINTDAGSAAANLGKLAGEIFTGDENTIISFPSIPGISAYMLEIPATSLSSPYRNAVMTIVTSFGSIHIKAGLLSNIPDLDGKTAVITIAAGDKTKLPEDTRAALGNHPLIQITLMLDGKQTDWNNPAAPVTVSIPYKPTPVELATPEGIVIWYVDGSCNLISVPNGRYDPATVTATFTTTHFSYYAIGYNKVSFNDVAATAWYKKAVSFIAARNITTGTGNGNFSPDAKLTRGQFITLLIRAYGIDLDANPSDNFADAGNTYYTGYIAVAKRLNISNGVGNNLFAPEKEITRQEMFTLLYNTLKVIGKLPEGDSGKKLSDITDAGQIDIWAKDAMTVLVETGTIQGSAGMLTPTSMTTRAEMAQVLYNLLSK